jgi:hypothetical protein
MRRRLRAGFYGERYFRRDGSTAGASGYASHLRENSNADVAAYLLWRFLPFERSLDIGAASGFLVEALLELGYDARGCDISEFAVSQAAPEVRERLVVADLGSWRGRRRVRGGPFSLVTALEVLEHLPPSRIPSTLRFLRGLCDGYLVATIPSIGPNDGGPDGLVSGKVREEVKATYLALESELAGPVPWPDLMRDAEDRPIEGHVCIAPFSWWTQQFEAAGFRRMLDVEASMHPVIGRFGDLAVAWNLYVFHAGDGPPAPAPARTDAELAAIEARWGLTDRLVGQNSLNITKDTVGPEAVDAIWREYNKSLARRAQASEAPAVD